MDIRPRVADDLDECLRLFEVVHERDGYPILMPDDLRAFVASGAELGAWVAVDSTGIVGHVVLNGRSWRGVMEVARDALGCDDADLAVVARLLVAPSARRSGAGGALLSLAARTAAELGRTPILDVAAHYDAAVALYEAEGWRRIGTAAFPLPDGTTLDELVFAFVGPR